MIMKRIDDDDTTGRNRRAGKDPAGESGKRPYCPMILRYSSRRSPLKDFLATQLQGVRLYDRIAGFFSSSLLEVAGAALERMSPESGETCVRVVCNSCLNPPILEIKLDPVRLGPFMNVRMIGIMIPLSRRLAPGARTIKRIK
jgi:hypothetical protein